MALLEVQGIQKHFGGLVVIRDISFTLERGEIVGLIGPNGAGKTTLFSMIAGALRADAGRILLSGRPVQHLPPHQLCRLGVARTFQIAKPFLGLSILENVLTAAFLRYPHVAAARQAAENVLDRVGLSPRGRGDCRSLGTADRKRLELARALVTEPQVLLLDETMAGLTPRETDGVLDLVRKVHRSGVTILLVEHVMQAVMGLSQRVLVLHQGYLLAQGQPDEIAHNPSVIEVYLGEDYRHA